jgi:predicted MPP superfamily phosphohydrolase
MRSNREFELMDFDISYTSKWIPLWGGIVFLNISLSVVRLNYFKILTMIFFLIIFANKAIGQTEKTSRLFFISDCQAPLFVEKMVGKTYRNGEATSRLFDDIEKKSPANLFILGDITGAGSQNHLWKPVDEAIQKLRQQNVAVHALLGNHEYFFNSKKAIDNYRKRFPTDALNGYCIRTGNMGVVMLNSNFDRLSTVEANLQQKWYLSVMDSLDNDPSIKAVLICTHHSPFTNSKVVSPSLTVQNCFLPRFFASQKTKLFLSGHSHNLEYFTKDKKHFLVTGGGGGIAQPLYTDKKQRFTNLIDWSEKPLYFYIVVEYKHNSLVMKAYGFKKDFKKIEKYDIGSIE